MIRSCCAFLALLPALALLPSCGGKAVPSPAEAPSRTVEGTIQLLSFSRLQGYEEGIPCSQARPAPLAAAGVFKRQLQAQDQTSRLALIGDSLMQPGVVSRSRSGVEGARARARVLLDAMLAAGVDILVPSHGDMELLGASELFDQAARRGLTVLVTNMDVEGRDDLPRYVLVQDHNLTLALLGAIPPKTAEGEQSDGAANGPQPDPGVHFVKPMRRIREVASGIMQRGEADMVAVLSNLPQKINQKLCEIPEVHFIIGTTDGGVKADMIARRSNTGMMFHQANGRELAQTTFRVVGGDMNMVDLSPVWALPPVLERENEKLATWKDMYGTNDPATLAPIISPGMEQDFMDKFSLHFENVEWVDEFRDFAGSSIAHHAVEFPQPGPDDAVLAALARQGPEISAAVDAITRPLQALDATSSIPVAEDCKHCHPAQYENWAATRHAHAYESIMAIQRHRDSSCLVCHAAGFGKEGGFIDVRLAAPYGGFTCWNCHGVKLAHATLQRGAVEPAFIAYKDRDTIGANCLGCHSDRRSPGFDLKRALDRVACPPMHADEPALIDAYAKALAAVERNVASGTDFDRDLYFKGRALVGLGRLEEGFAAIRRFSETNTEFPYQATEIADYLDDHGDSQAALDTLRSYLEHSPSDPVVNLAYADLLLHAKDPDARSPALAASHLGVVAPYDLTTKMDAAELPLRKIQAEALFEAGREAEGYSLLTFLANNFKSDEQMQALLERYLGDQAGRDKPR